MSNLFAKARDWLPGKVQEAAGVSVTYSRAGETDLALTAVSGATRFRSEHDGVRVEIGDRDYLVRVADLTYGTPRVGDRVAEEIDGTVITFECQTPENGEPAWRYTDDRAEYRLHCKRVAVSSGQ